MKNIVFLLYAFLCIGFVFFSFLFIDENLVYLKLLYTGFATTEREVTVFMYTLFIVLFFGFYIFIIYKFKTFSLKIIKTLIAISAILLLAYPAVLSYDIFNYILTAKVTFFYHENPYIIMPVEFVNEPYLAFTRATNKLALYGPLWILMTGIPYLLGFGKFVLTMYLFKLLTAIFYFASVFLVYRLSKDLKATTIFALNPLVLIETFVSGHNDIVMVSLLLSGILLFTTKRYGTSIIFVIGSILIKYATVFFIPGFIFFVYKLIKNKPVSLDTIAIFTLVSLSIIFLLSPIREELYPWYFIWLVPFISLLHKNKRLLMLGVALSFGLMLRYIPFMAIGDYFGYTPLIRNVLMALPILFVLVYLAWKKQLLKN